MPPKGSPRPTKTLLTQQKSDEVRTLTNYSDELIKWYDKWLGIKATYVKVELKNPNDYGDVHRICMGELEALAKRKTRDDLVLCGT